MFLNRLIVHIFILYYFGVVKSTNVFMWEHKPIRDSDLENEYVKIIVEKGKNLKTSHSICSKYPTDEDKITVMTACTYTFGRIRSTDRKYRQYLYLYHNYYDTINEPMCLHGTVELSKSYDIGNSTEQAMIPCYGRLSITETNFLRPGITETHTLPESHFFYKFLIFPTSNTFSSWLVFQYNKFIKTYTLIKWFYVSNIEEYLIPANLLIFQPPMRTTDISEIYVILYPFILTWKEVSTSGSHVLHQVNSAELTNLCIKITDVEKNPTTSYNIGKQFPSNHQLILQSPKVSNPIILETWGYSCDVHIAQQDWFLFTAPGDDAIILGKLHTQNDHEKFYIIKKYIKNVNYEFLFYFL